MSGPFLLGFTTLDYAFVHEDLPEKTCWTPDSREETGVSSHSVLTDLEQVYHDIVGPLSRYESETPSTFRLRCRLPLLPK